MASVLRNSCSIILAHKLSVPEAYRQSLDEVGLEVAHDMYLQNHD